MRQILAGTGSPRIFRVTYILILNILAMSRGVPMEKYIPYKPGSHND